MLSRLLHGGRHVLAAWHHARWSLAPSDRRDVGYRRRAILAVALNMMVMRTTDVFYAFPSVLLAVAISGALRPGITTPFYRSRWCSFLPLFASRERRRRVCAISTMSRPHRASGAGSLRIVRVHVLPNVIGPIFMYATRALTAFLHDSRCRFSFLGLGARPPEAEWGFMLNTLRTPIYSMPEVASVAGYLHLHHQLLLQSPQRWAAAGDGYPRELQHDDFWRNGR